METPNSIAPRLHLPAAPSSEHGEVKAWQESVDILSFLPGEPDRNPMFLERRVYQGSSGDVYPLPLIDRIETEPVLKSWQAVHLENRFIRLMILPEIGGRIHVGMDKVNGYDFFYRQNVIKPALVGLAGPWMSGGVEFNWPQHHRPATFLPADVSIERGQDGSVTVWCSDYDRASGMKGMHGVCLHPEQAIVELKVRLYNGTEAPQTFLWWANVAARVHENYQSFFPPDVRYVADHAKRAVSTFPLAQGTYYGVDYAARAANGVPCDEAPERFPPGGYPANDLSRYANIPVPTSYMVVHSDDDFFGGYDHAAKAGFVHVANRHIAPGKKQWTWGNQEFGYAWDRCLTDNDGPYIELMAGVYTDNQPDFSFLGPGETKTFSQFWYPLRDSGVPGAANLSAALSLVVSEREAHVSISVTRDLPKASVRLRLGNQLLTEWKRPITVTSGIRETFPLPQGCDTTQLSAELYSEEHSLLRFARAPPPEQSAPALAVEPPLPEDIQSAEELFLTGVHLEQYRHATRSPEPYWREALRRDLGDSRANHALARMHLKRGEFALAETLLRRAIQRVTRLNGNPYDGEVYYTLGCVLRHLGRTEEAYAAFYKATWNFAWRAPSHHCLAELDAVRGRIESAVEHLQQSLRLNAENLNARNLLASLLGSLDHAAAQRLAAETVALDPLDRWSTFLEDRSIPENGFQALALSLLMERGNQLHDAGEVLSRAIRTSSDGSLPLLHIAFARCSTKLGDERQANFSLDLASAAEANYCFPNGLGHLALLEYAIVQRPDAPAFHLYLGNLLFHHRRHNEGIAHWERAVELDPACAQAWRNLGIGYYNIRRDASAAQQVFDRAVVAAPNDARIFYERDQLQKRLDVSSALRLEQLQAASLLVARRDDLSLELATLLNELKRPAEALSVLLTRHFQPWEGGEGLILRQFTEAKLQLSQLELQNGRPVTALEHLSAALHPPASLGEAHHPLSNRSNIFYWMGEALLAAGKRSESASMFERSASQQGDFQSMAVQQFSEMTYWSCLSLYRLGRSAEAQQISELMLKNSRNLEMQTAKIDYFATSLPTLLVFEEDVASRKKERERALQATALMCLDLSAPAVSDEAPEDPYQASRDAARLSAASSLSEEG